MPPSSTALAGHSLPFAPADDPWLAPRKRTFSPQDWAILARHWYPVARVQDVTDRPVAATLLDLELVVYRTPEGVKVARDLCPHRGVPLTRGTVDDGQLVCMYHGLHFGGDGRCTKIPAHPDATPSASLALRMFPAHERYGLVWTCLSPTGSDTAIPAFPFWDDAHYQQVSPPFVDIAGSAGRQIEGFVDVAHFAWIHHESFAERGAPQVPAYEVERTATGVRAAYLSDVSNFPKTLQHLAPPGFKWLRVFDIHPPFTATLAIHFPEGGMHHILNAASPVAAFSTRLFTPVARNFGDVGSPEETADFKIRIVMEDRDIVESQYPSALPLDTAIDAHFPADRMSLAYRRLLRDMGLTLRPAPT